MTNQAANPSYAYPPAGPQKRSFLAGCFSIVFLAIFIIAGAAALFAVNAEFLLFRKDAYLQAFEENGVYERIPALITNLMAADLQSGQTLPETLEGQPPEEGSSDRGIFQYLEAEEYQAILSTLFPPEWIREQTGRVLDGIFAYINLQTPDLRMEISTAEIRERLQGETGKALLEQIMASWPPCTLSQLLEMAAAGLDGSLENLPVCLPPAEYLPAVTPLLQEGLQAMAAGIPDKVDLASPSTGEGAGSATGQASPGVDPLQGRPKQVYSFLRWSLRGALFAALGVLALLTLVAVRSGRDMAFWWGLSFTGAGLLALVASLSFGIPIGTQLLERAVPIEIITSLPDLARVVMDVGRSVLERYFYWVGVESIVVALAGFALLAVSFLLRRRG
jgi:hypothetical protein